MGLIAHYRLDGDATDAVGDNHGTATGTSWVPGKLGEMASGGGVSIPHDESLSIANKLSISFWVKRTAEITAYSEAPIAKYSGTGTANFRCYVFGSSQSLRFYANHGGTWGVVSGSYTLPLNELVHIAWTYDNGGQLYVNGVSTGSKTGSGLLALNETNIQIGSGSLEVDDVRIYDHALSQREVRDLSSLRAINNVLPEALRNMTGSTGWALSHHSFISTSFLENVHGRAHVHRAYWDGSGNGDWYSRVYLDALLSGVDLYFSRDYKVTQGTAKPNNPILYQDGWKGGGYGSRTFLYDKPIGGGWRRIAHRFTTTAYAPNPTLRMSTGYVSGVWELFMDNFQVEIATDPGSFTDGETVYPNIDPVSDTKASIDSEGSVHTPQVREAIPCWQNFGGPKWSLFGSNISDNAIRASTETLLVQPFSETGVMKSGRDVEAYNEFIGRDNVVWIKRVTSYDSSGNKLTGQSGPYPQSYNVYLHFPGGVSMGDVLNAENGEKLAAQVSMYIDDRYYGRTDIVNKNSSTSIGFANAGDTYGQPADNLMENWGARHVISYRRGHSGQNAIRCQFQCWGGSEDIAQEVIWECLPL